MKNKELYWFLGIAVSLYLIWELTYEPFIGPIINMPLSKSLAITTSKLLGLFGMDASTFNPPEGFFKSNPNAASSLLVDGKPTVTIAHECNGLELMVLFMGFVMAYPGRWALKVPYILVGLIAIYFVNIIRIILLTFNSMYFPDSLDFNHHYTFTIAVYLVVFYMWVLWANKYSSHKLKAVSSQTEAQEDNI